MARRGFAGAYRGFSGLAKLPQDGIIRLVPEFYDTTDTPVDTALDLRCHDCQANVPRPIEQCETPLEHAEHYCPLCAKPVAIPLQCAQCESDICPGCGTPLELADELGIG